MKTYTVTIKVPHYYDYQVEASTEEEAKIDAMLTPELATILIKLVGDVSFLTEVRDNKSNNG